MPNSREPFPSGPNSLGDYKMRADKSTQDLITKQVADYQETKKGKVFMTGLAFGVMAFGLQATAQIFVPELSCYFAAISIPLSTIAIGLFSKVILRQNKIVSEINVSAAKSGRFFDSIDPKQVAEEEVRRTNDYIHMN